MLDPSILINYTPAQLHEGKCWYIDFYAFHPACKRLKRKQIKFNRIKNLTERRKYVLRVVEELNIKLASGWNPFLEQEATKSSYYLTTAMKSFLDDKREARPDTIRTYMSFLHLFKSWVIKKYGKEVYVNRINSPQAIEYMEDMWNKDISARRYNNYLGFQRLFFNWLIEHNYSKSNPFLKIKKRKTAEKIREMEISIEDRKTIRDYLNLHNNRFLAMVYLAFHSLIRPKEIVYLKGRNIDLKKQAVLIDESFSKNHNYRVATIPNVMIDLMKEIMKDVRNDDYIFSKHFMKGSVMIDSREITRYWSYLRRTLELKKEIQFYSLRDSGIIQKLRDGLNPKEVMELADHSSLEVTNRYVRMSTKEPNKEAMKKMSEF